jgi:3-methyladenine DNA glycosylase AlkD
VTALGLIEVAANDDRHYVKKAVNMALRATGKRNPRLRAASVALAERLAASKHESARWVGRDALRELAVRAEKPRAGAAKARARAKPRKASR